MAPAVETDKPPPPNVECHCEDCQEFRLPYDSLWNLFEKPRPTDGVSGGIADALWEAWLNTRDAWGRHQKHFTHEFTPEERTGTQEDELRERYRARARDAAEPPPQPSTQPAPQSQPDLQKNNQSTGEAQWRDGRFYGKFMVCDHCHSHSLKCTEASVCDQCELHGQPCVHRECILSPFKDQCPNEECRYVHRRDLPPKGRNDPSWIIIPGRLKGYRESGFRLNMPLESLSKMHSVERIRLLQPLQTQAIDATTAAAARGQSLATYHQQCVCPTDDLEARPEKHVKCPPMPGAFERNTGGDPECRECQTSISVFWAVTPCNTRTCLDCALCKCLINTGPRCDCRADKCPYLVMGSSLMWWNDVSPRYQVSRNHDIYAEAKWLRDHLIVAIDHKRKELYG